MKKKDRLYLLVFLLLFLDQASKYLIVQNFSLHESISIIPSFFDLCYIQNEGAAWGMFSSVTWLITIFSALFLVLFNQYLLKKEDFSSFSLCYYSLLMSGVLGNLVDRVLHQYVIDFFHFTFFDYSFPVFNVADIFIVVGMILVVFDILRSEYYGYRIKKEGR